MIRVIVVLSVVSALAIASASAFADNLRKEVNPTTLTAHLNGSPLHRATVLNTSGTPKDTSNSSASGSVTYTFLGGERICVQAAEAAFVEVVASASMTASGAKAFKVAANAPLSDNCFTLTTTQTKISVDCVTGDCTAVKFFELR